MIPEELAPLANFSWEQFSDLYVENHDIQPEPHVAIQLESGIPGGGTKVVVDVKDVRHVMVKTTSADTARTTGTVIKSSAEWTNNHSMG